MRKLKKQIFSIIVVIALILLMISPATRLIGFADSCTFGFSGATVEVGETFKLTLTWDTTDSDLGAFEADIIYDSSVLELVSGDSRLVPAPPTTAGVKTLSYEYSFKALKAGTTSVTIKPDSAYSFTNEAEFEWTVNPGTVTITEQPTEAPTDPPTEAPTDPPTEAPTDPPTEAPTVPPTEAPTEPPTEAPTVPPTEAPTMPPTEAPTMPPETLSSNGKLDALSVSPGTLSPAFSTDVHWYDVYVDNDVTVLNVDAVTSDEHATWVVTETRKDLKVGKNYVGVKVTAQDGSIEWYEMYVYRAAAETDAPTDEPTEAPTEAPTNEPTTDAEPTDPLEVMIGNVNGKIQQTLGDVKRPEGFEETTYNYKGVDIEVLKGLGKDLLLIPVSDGAKTALYLYDEDNGGFYPYVGIQITSALYTVLPFSANETVPAGYSLTTVDFQGTLIDAWVRNDAADKNYAVFYAMNWNGETALYRYDAGEQTLQRVVKSELGVGSGAQNPTVGTGESTGSNGNHQVSDDYLEYYEETLQRVNRRDTFMFILMVVLLICMVAMYLLFVVGKDDKDAKDEDENASEEEESEEEESEEEESEEEESEEDESNEEDEDDSDEEEMDSDEDEALQHELEDIQVGMADFMADLSETEETSDEFQLDELQDDDLEDLDLNSIK